MFDAMQPLQLQCRRISRQMKAFEGGRPSRLDSGCFSMTFAAPWAILALVAAVIPQKLLANCGFCPPAFSRFLNSVLPITVFFFFVSAVLYVCTRSGGRCRGMIASAPRYLLDDGQGYA